VNGVETENYARHLLFPILLQAKDNRLLGQTIRIATESLQATPKDDIQFIVDIDPLDMF